MRADAVGDPGRLSVHHRDLRVVDAQALGADLRHNRLEALAKRCAAGDELYPAVLIEFDADGILRPQSGLLDKKPETDTDRLALFAPARELGLGFLPAEFLERAIQ